MRIALDTNVLVYAEGVDDPARQSRATELLSRLPRDMLLISVQVVGELFNVLLRRNLPREVARERASFWSKSLKVHGTSLDLMATAINLAAEHKVRIWDAVILAAAAETNCSVLLSEDFQDGFVWQGVTVCNPFLAKTHPLIANLVRA